MIFYKKFCVPSHINHSSFYLFLRWKIILLNIIHQTVSQGDSSVCWWAMFLVTVYAEIGTKEKCPKENEVIQARREGNWNLAQIAHRTVPCDSRAIVSPFSISIPVENAGEGGLPQQSCRFILPEIYFLQRTFRYFSQREKSVSPGTSSLQCRSIEEFRAPTGALGSMG